jgi:hypothetical protein
MNRCDPFGAAERRRDLGIERAVDHADRVRAEWSERAVELLRSWALGRPPFLAEQFRETAAKIVGHPPDARAWGAVVRAAAAEGYIRRVGYAPALSSNLSPKCLWEPL